MTKPEKIFFDFIRKHIVLIMAIAITGFGILIRVFGINFESDDYQSFLSIRFVHFSAVNSSGDRWLVSK